ncbi:hypothetical protein AB4564_17660, partial [Vibrio sp. 10N.222.51.E8]
DQHALGYILLAAPKTILSRTKFNRERSTDPQHAHIKILTTLLVRELMTNQLIAKEIAARKKP